MKSVYLSRDGETLILRDDADNKFILFNKVAEQPTEVQADESRKANRERIEKKCGYCHKLGHKGKDCPNKPGKKRRGKANRLSHRGPRHCKTCGKPGHTSRTCPEGKPRTDFSDSGQKGKRCFACHSEDHNTVNCPELEETIAKMQKEGMDSLRVASELHITLGLVNKFWNAGAAKEEEEEEI